MTLHPLIEPGWVNAIIPELILCVGGMLLMLFAAFAPRLRSITAPLALIVFIVAAWAENLVRAGRFFGSTYEISGITRIFDITFLLAAMLATLFAREYLERENIEGGEFYALLMWATVGMMMMAKGLDLLIVILGVLMDDPVDPARFSHELAIAINQVALDPALRKTFGANGRKRVEDHFSWTAIAQRTLELYRSLV